MVCPAALITKLWCPQKQARPLEGDMCPPELSSLHWGTFFWIPCPDTSDRDHLGVFYQLRKRQLVLCNYLEEGRRFWTQDWPHLLCSSWFLLPHRTVTPARFPDASQDLKLTKETVWPIGDFILPLHILPASLYRKRMTWTIFNPQSYTVKKRRGPGIPDSASHPESLGKVECQKAQTWSQWQLTMHFRFLCLNFLISKVDPFIMGLLGRWIQ